MSEYTRLMISKLREMLRLRGYTQEPAFDYLERLNFDADEPSFTIVHRVTHADTYYGTIVFALNNHAEDVNSSNHVNNVSIKSKDLALQYAQNGIVLDKTICIYKNGMHYLARERVGHLSDNLNMLHISDLEVGVQDHMFSPSMIKKLTDEEVHDLAAEIRMKLSDLKSGRIPVIYSTRHMASYLDLKVGDVIMCMEPSIARYEDVIELEDGSKTVISSIIDMPKYYVTMKPSPDEEKYHKEHVREAHSDRAKKKSVRQVNIEYMYDELEDDTDE